MLKSKRFWVTLSAVIGAAGAAYTNEISWGVAIQTSVAAIATLVIGYSIADVANK